MQAYRKVLVSVESGSLQEWLVYQKFKAPERRIRACVKKFDLYLMVMIFEVVRSKIRGVGRKQTIEV
jgi:hypothetical protein